MEPIILASGSPRRQELLQQIGVPFEVVKSDAEELTEVPKKENWYIDLATENAKRKAVDVAYRYRGRLVLAADTVVYSESTDSIYGKPKNEGDAKRMLRELAAQDHYVCTAVALVIPDANDRNKATISLDSDATIVSFRGITEQEIEDYVATGEPMDKAGAYAIQGLGAIFVEQIEGSYSTVVGLPLYETSRLLMRAGVKIL